MLFDNIAIAITNKCNASCKMCCFKCGPENDVTLEKELVYDIINQSADIDEIEKIAFTGGEALLYPDLIFDAMKLAKQKNMKTSLTTNGFWANDYNNCLSILKELKNLSLFSMSISIDEYHLQYVDINCFRNIIKANKGVGIPISVAIGDSFEERSAFDVISELSRDLYGCHIRVFPFIPVGNADNIPKDKIYLQEYNNSWKCGYSNNFAILYNGDTYPCCSQAIYNSSISSGNIKEKPLRELMVSYQNKGIFSTLHRKKFEWFINIAKKEMDWTLPTQFVSSCHLCNILFSNEEFVKCIRPYIEKEYTEHLLSSIGIAYC